MTDAPMTDLHYTDGRFEPIPSITEAVENSSDIRAFLADLGWEGCFTPGGWSSELRPFTHRRHTPSGSWQYLLEFSDGMRNSQYILTGLALVTCAASLGALRDLPIEVVMNVIAFAGQGGAA